MLSEIPVVWTWPGCKGRSHEYSCSEYLLFLEHLSLSFPMTISNLPFRQLPLFCLWSMVSPWTGSTKMHGWMCDPHILQNMEPLASEFAQEVTSIDTGSVHVYPKAFVELLGRGTPCLLQKGQQYIFI